jgi:hypothetical protein
MYGVKPMPPDLGLVQPTWGGLTSTWDLKSSSFQQDQRPGSSNSSQGNAPKRKRKTTPAQRIAANVRERRRMCSLNSSFDKLRKRVPAFPHEKRLSRIQTLRLAMFYISFMTEMLTGQDIQTLIKRHQQQTSQNPQPANQNHGHLQGADDSKNAGAIMWQQFDQCGQMLFDGVNFINNGLVVI